LNLETLDWDHGLIDLFQIPESLLPSVKPSSCVYGETEPELFGRPIPLGGAAGDQQSALFGQNCTRHGMAKNTYGTGCFALMNIGSQPQQSANKLLCTPACGAAGAAPDYALEGSVFIAGAAVQWLRDGLEVISDSSEIESLARTVDDSDGVYLVPAFAGLGAPHWDPYARGMIVGITRGTRKAHLARATLESIAFQVADVLDAMQHDSGVKIQELRVDGGGSVNDLMMQFQSDILGVPVVRPQVTETTALGAAYLAGLAVEFWEDNASIEAVWSAEKTFHPRMPAPEVASRRERWRDALQRSRGWDS
jgi:glycerol kinase